MGKPTYLDMASAIDVIEQVGDLLREHREKSKMSFRDVSKETNLSPSILCRIEQGEKCRTDSLLILLKWMTGRD